MFEMLDELDDEYGSEQRYNSRVANYKDKRQPLKRHLFWWLVHNCVAHPLIGVFPIKTFFDLHDWTSGKINLRPPLKNCPILDDIYKIVVGTFKGKHRRLKFLAHIRDCERCKSAYDDFETIRRVEDAQKRP
jgi:hypothetical protein